jgi:hypothetical protein
MKIDPAEVAQVKAYALERCAGDLATAFHMLAVNLVHLRRGASLGLLRTPPDMPARPGKPPHEDVK